MKKLLLLLLLVVIAISSIAQPVKKTNVKEKPPTQKEINDMMKEMENAVNEMSEEDKRMMDSMGIKMPSAKNLPKITDKQLATAWEEDNRIVPARDDKRIAAIPKKLNEANMKSYLVAIQQKTAQLLTPELRAAGDKIYEYIRTNSKDNKEAGNMASGLWMAGKQEFALAVMGKLCSSDPANTDNLSNYASMLSMLGAQHLAIPILNNLNVKFPGNSTLLNNLGQAWYGLGEISKAENYLDSAIRLYAYHPQANLTKAAIEESKGNIPKAIEAVKRSIKHGYTDEKEAQLRKLGHKLNIRDLRFVFKPGPDPLGLEKFRRPEYPTSVSELKVLKPLWMIFDNECDALRAQLQNQKKEWAASYEKSLKSGRSMFKLPLHHRKATIQLEELRAHYETEIARVSKKFMVLGADLEQIKQQRKRAAPEAPCQDHLRAENDFLKKHNERKKAYDEEILKVFKHYSNDMAYWSQFTAVSEAQFQLVVIEFQIDWLSKLKEYRPLLSSALEFSDCPLEEEEEESGKLAEFDDVACNYNDTMDLKLIVFYNNCSKMTSKLNLKFVEYTRIDNFNRPEDDTYVSSSIKFSAEKGFDQLKLEKGPLKLEAKVGAAIEMEFDREGIKDIIVMVEAKAGAGHNLYDEGLEKEGSIAGKDVIDTTLEVGVEGRISIISGKGQVKGTGMLENIKLGEW